ncbi:DNA gyrase inhibitor YacG [Pajaroellobacter abortibovis]|uniref:DNA gyrase inhibitor YacG n=1 Tax=Pajaroellobacter abortibovis TaxID=1882918 RepID=UPI0009F95C77|nr:DNA gyrase inhibitor YacG [Pajaroellobacter abortibovis]
MNERFSARCIVCGCLKTKLVGKESHRPLGPFCSERCRQVDLGRWLGEEYRIVDTSERNRIESDFSESALSVGESDGTA